MGDLRWGLSVGGLRILAVAAGVLLGAALLGFRASLQWLGLLAVGMGAIVLLQQPLLGLLALVPAALWSFP